MTGHLELASWRRSVAELYAAVRADADPRRAHGRWRTGRDRLFREHPSSPLAPADPLRETGLPYWPYDPHLRFRTPFRTVAGQTRVVPTGGEATVTLDQVGEVYVPAPVDATLAVWWLREYSGGLFLPVRDATAGSTSYGGGRYLLDTAKGADLGGDPDTLVLDFNFLYHPSCRYSPAWVCPLAPDTNRIESTVEAGERL